MLVCINHVCSLTLDSQLYCCIFYNMYGIIPFFSFSISPSISDLVPCRRWSHPVLHLSFSSLSFSFTSGQAAVAGQGSVGWEGVEGKRGKKEWKQAINCKAQGTVKKRKK